MESSKDSFEQTLRQKVSSLFEQEGITRYADRRILFKAITFIILIIVSYISIFLSAGFISLLVSYSLLGLSNILLSINIGHEAIHNCLSAEKKINSLGRLTFNIAGVSPLIWGTKHLNSHHKHTNIPELDTDFQQSKLIRLAPDYPKSKFHSYQQYYIPLFYLFYTFHWTYIKDFKEAFNLSGNRISNKNIFSLTSLIVNKICYLIVFLVIPLLAHNLNLNIVTGFLSSYVVTGAFFGLFLIPIHINDYSQIQKNLPNNKLTFKDQLSSTPNFSTKSRSINFFLGGFNHHACHHLFPSISHIHYPQITRLIKEASHDEGIVYNCLTYPELLKSHFRHLQKLANMP